MSDIKESYYDYFFHFFNDINNPVIQIISAGKQTRNNKRYYWDNKNRRKCYLFQYTISGSATVEIYDKKYIVDKGKCFFLKLPGNSRYYFDELRNEAPYEHIYIMFTGNGAAEYYDYIEKHFGNIFSLPVYSRAIQTLFEIYSMAESNTVNDPFILSSKVFEFICALCSENINNKPKTMNIAFQAKEYLEQNCTEQIGISDTADYLKISQSHLSREFFKQFGEKPVEYLTKLRLKKAIKLLISTPLKIEEISTKCGFSSSNYFNKVFKKYMNTTPKQFRDYVKNEGYSNIRI